MCVSAALTHFENNSTIRHTTQQPNTQRLCKMALSLLISKLRLHGIPKIPSLSHCETSRNLSAPLVPIDSQELGQGEPAVIGYGYSVMTVYQMALWVCVRIKEHTVGVGRMEKQQLGFALLIQRREKWACFSPSPVVH